MDVRTCKRSGCENIMCDYYSPIYGYICDEYIQEYENSNISFVAEFIETKKDTIFKEKLHKENIYTIFNDLSV